MQPEAERSHRRFQLKLLTLGVFISNCKQERAKRSANSTAGSTALGTAASLLQQGSGCNGAVLGILLQPPTAAGASWLPAVAF